MGCKPTWNWGWPFLLMVPGGWCHQAVTEGTSEALGDMAKTARSISKGKMISKHNGCVHLPIFIQTLHRSRMTSWIKQVNFLVARCPQGWKIGNRVMILPYPWWGCPSYPCLVSGGWVIQSDVLDPHPSAETRDENVTRHWKKITLCWSSSLADVFCCSIELDLSVARCHAWLP